MRKTLLFVAFSTAAVLTLFIAGCSKKDSGPTNNMAAIAGTYKLSSVTVTVGGVTQDGMSLVPVCQQDDILQLKADSTFINTDAGTQCSPPDDETGKWWVSGSSLIQSANGSNDTITIKSISNMSLVLTHVETVQNVTGTVTLTLAKQ
jgi:hypothetical protein